LLTKKEFTAEKKSAIYLSLGLNKDTKATEEAFSPQRTSSISKHEISLLIFIFTNNFCPSGSGFRIRILNADPDPATQLNVDPDPKPCMLHIFNICRSQ
jgi:hypothetical protein